MGCASSVSRWYSWWSQWCTRIALKNSFVVVIFIFSGELLYDHVISTYFTMGWVGVGCNLTDIFSGHVFELSPVVLFSKSGTPKLLSRRIRFCNECGGLFVRHSPVQFDLHGVFWTCFSVDFSVLGWVGVTLWLLGVAWLGNALEIKHWPQMGNCESFFSFLRAKFSSKHVILPTFFDFNFAKLKKLYRHHNFSLGEETCRSKNWVNPRILQHVPGFLSKCWVFSLLSIRQPIETVKCWCFRFGLQICKAWMVELAFTLRVKRCGFILGRHLNRH